MIQIIIGILIGSFLSAVGFAVFNRGTLVVDTSDTDSPYIFLEITKGNMNDILNSKYVMFKVSERA